MDGFEKDPEGAAEGFIELLVEIAGLQQLQLHWGAAAEKDESWEAKSQVLADMLERRLLVRKEWLKELREEYPEIEEFAWAEFDTYDA